MDKVRNLIPKIWILENFQVQDEKQEIKLCAHFTKRQDSNTKIKGQLFGT